MNHAPTNLLPDCHPPARPIRATLQLAALLTALAAPGALPAQDTPTATPEAMIALPALDVPGYMGTWYQVAWFPNRFQRQCVSDTRAEYQQLPDGRIRVLNRCRLANGQMDEADGLARPAGSVLEGTQLKPAQLEVSFLPAWLRWVPAWGRYWVIARADDGRYAVVSEPQREYLWVLAREPRLSADDEATIRSQLTKQGFDLARWQAHPHTAEAPRR
jgi:apolipoprotein D and lipocalin family protein